MHCCEIPLHNLRFECPNPLAFWGAKAERGHSHQLQELPSIEFRVQLHRGNEVKLRVICLNGFEAEVEAARTEQLAALKDRITAALHLNSGLSDRLELVCAGQVVPGHWEVGHLPAFELQAVLNKELSITPIGSELRKGGALYVSGGALASSKIYFAPYDAPRCLCVDPQTNDTFEFGPELDGFQKYEADAVGLANAIYLAPLEASHVLRIDPETNDVEEIGGHLGEGHKYAAGGVYAEGKIYFAPFDAMRVLCIHAEEGRVEEIGPEMSGPEKYKAPGILANGCIYFFPCNAQSILCVDPRSDHVQEIDPGLANAGAKYTARPILAASGKLYAAPCDAMHVLVLDPITNAVKEIGPKLDTTSCKYTGSGVLAPSGRLYFAPCCANRVLCIDPSIDSVIELEDVRNAVSGGLYEAGGFCTLDGRIVFAPSLARQVLVVEDHTQAATLVGPELEGGEMYWDEYLLDIFPKYIAQGVVAKGRMYCAPGVFPDKVGCIDP